MGWFCAGPIVRKAYRYEGAQETYDALLPAEDPPPEPFDASDRLLLPAFRDVLERDASYMDLRVWDDE